MPPSLRSLQIAFPASSYRRALDAALNFDGSYTDRHVVIAAVDETCPLESIREQPTELDPERIGILIPTSAKSLPVANAALDNAIRPQVSKTARRLRQLDRTLRQRLGAEYRITAYFPPRVLAGEPALQNIKPGALMEPALTEPERQPAVTLALLLPIRPAH